MTTPPSDDVLLVSAMRKLLISDQAYVWSDFADTDHTFGYLQVDGDVFITLDELAAVKRAMS